MKTMLFCTDGKPGSENCPGVHDTVSYYSQITLNEECEIPEAKPGSAKLISKYHSLEIQRVETIDLIVKKTDEQAAGKKVIVTGNLRLGIEYADHKHNQKVHFFECLIPFNAVVLECHCGEERLLPEEFCLDDYLVHVCLEHLQVNQVSERIFAKTAILMIWLQPKRACRACR
jgi:hypothetical protein